MATSYYRDLFDNANAVYHNVYTQSQIEDIVNQHSGGKINGQQYFYEFDPPNTTADINNNLSTFLGHLNVFIDYLNSDEFTNIQDDIRKIAILEYLHSVESKYNDAIRNSKYQDIKNNNTLILIARTYSFSLNCNSSTKRQAFFRILIDRDIPNLADLWIKTGSFNKNSPIDTTIANIPSAEMGYKSYQLTKEAVANKQAYFKSKADEYTGTQYIKIFNSEYYQTTILEVTEGTIDTTTYPSKTVSTKGNLSYLSYLYPSTSTYSKEKVKEIIKYFFTQLASVELKVAYSKTDAFNYLDKEQKIECLQNIPIEYWPSLKPAIQILYTQTNNYIKAPSDLKNVLFTQLRFSDIKDFIQQMSYIRTNTFLQKTVTERKNVIGGNPDFLTKIGTELGTVVAGTTDYKITAKDKVDYLAAFGQAALLTQGYPANLLYKKAEPISLGYEVKVQQNTGNPKSLTANAQKSKLAVAPGSENVKRANKIMLEAAKRSAKGYFYIDIEGEKVNDTVLTILTEPEYNVNYQYTTYYNYDLEKSYYRFSWEKNASLVDDYTLISYIGSDGLPKFIPNYYNHILSNIQDKTEDAKVINNTAQLKNIRINILNAADEGLDFINVLSISDENKVELQLAGFTIEESEFETELVGSDGKLETQTVNGYTISWKQRIVKNNEDAKTISEIAIDNNNKLELIEILTEISSKANEGATRLQRENIANENILALENDYGFEIIRFTDYYEISWSMMNDNDKIAFEKNNILNTIAYNVYRDRNSAVVQINYYEPRCADYDKTIGDLANTRAGAKIIDTRYSTLELIESFGFNYQKATFNEYKKYNTYSTIIGEDDGEKHLVKNEDLDSSGETKPPDTGETDTPIEQTNLLVEEEGDENVATYKKYFNITWDESFTHNIEAQVRNLQGKIEFETDKGNVKYSVSQSIDASNVDAVHDITARILQMEFFYQVTPNDDKGLYVISWSDTIAGAVSNAVANRLYTETHKELVDQQVKDIAGQIAQKARDGETYIDITSIYDESIEILRNYPYFYKIIPYSDYTRIFWDETKEKRYKDDLRTKINISKSEYASYVVPQLGLAIYNNYSKTNSRPISSYEQSGDTKMGGTIYNVNTNTLIRLLSQQMGNSIYSNHKKQVLYGTGSNFDDDGTLGLDPYSYYFCIKIAKYIEATNVNSDCYVYYLKDIPMDNYLELPYSTFSYPEIIVPGYEMTDVHKSYQDLNENDMIDVYDVFDTGLTSHMGLENNIQFHDKKLLTGDVSNELYTGSSFAFTLDDTTDSDKSLEVQYEERKQQLDSDDTDNLKYLNDWYEQKKKDNSNLITSTTSKNNDLLTLKWTNFYGYTINYLVEVIAGIVKDTVNQTIEKKNGDEIHTFIKKSMLSSFVADVVLSILTRTYGFKITETTNKDDGLKYYDIVWEYDGTDPSDPMEKYVQSLLSVVAKGVYPSGGTSVLNYPIEYKVVRDRFNNLYSPPITIGTEKGTNSGKYDITWTTAFKNSIIDILNTMKNTEGTLRKDSNYKKDMIMTINGRYGQFLWLQNINISNISSRFESLKEILFSTLTIPDGQTKKAFLTEYANRYKYIEFQALVEAYSMVLGGKVYNSISNSNINLYDEYCIKRSASEEHLNVRELTSETNLPTGFVSANGFIYRTDDSNYNNVCMLIKGVSGKYYLLYPGTPLVEADKVVLSNYDAIRETIETENYEYTKDKVMVLTAKMSESSSRDFKIYIAGQILKQLQNFLSIGYHPAKVNYHDSLERKIVNIILTSIHQFTSMVPGTFSLTSENNNIESSLTAIDSNCDIAYKFTTATSITNPESTAYSYLISWEETGIDPFLIYNGSLISDSSEFGGESGETPEVETPTDSSTINRKAAYEEANKARALLAAKELSEIMTAIHTATNKGLYYCDIDSIMDENYLALTNDYHYEVQAISGKIRISWPSQEKNIPEKDPVTIPTFVAAVVQKENN